MLAIPILAIHLLKQCIYFRYRKNCNHPFFEVNASFSLVAPFFVTRCQSLSFAVPYCHLLSLVVPLFVIRCHSLSFAVTRCHSLYHSLPFVVTRCYSLSLAVRLVVTRCTSRLSFYRRCVSNRPCLYTLLISSFFIYLSVRLRTMWNIKDKLLQQQKAVKKDLNYPLAVPISNNGLFEKT